MQSGILPDRQQKFNDHLKGMIEFYKNPLVKAILALRKRGLTLQEISDEVFDGEISRQAVHEGYLKKEAK